MAAFGACFESAKSIDEKREAKRIARERELQKAKDAFEKLEKLKEQKRLRGEDTWMLDGVNERLDQLAQEHSGKKKKKKEKHSKKAKKEKKQKSKKQKLEKSEECTDSSSESENEWVESAPVSQPQGTQKAWKIKTAESDKEATAAVQRDEWMTLDFMSMKTTSVASIRAEKQKEKEAELEQAQAIEKANALSRELNPYWKDGGSGLPPEEKDAISVKKAVLVEDGGLSWLRKSYQRMKEQSEREKRDLDDIIATRYGSVEIFQAKMEEAEKQSSSRYGDRNEDRRSIQRDSGDRHASSFRASSRHSYGDARQEKDGRNRLEERLRPDEEEYGKCNTEPQRRGQGSRTETESSRLQRSSTSGGLKTKFLRPSDDDGLKSKFLLPSDDDGLKSKFLRPSDDDGLGSGQKSRVGLSSTSGGHKAKFVRPSEDESFCYKSSRGRDLDREESSLSKCLKKPAADTNGDPTLSRGATKAGKCHKESHRQPEAPEKTPTALERTPKEEKRKSGVEHQKASPDRKEQSPERKSSASRLESDAEPIRVLSEEEMNKLGAKLVKAELMGNTDLASKLKDQLETARALRTSQAQVPPCTSTKKTEPGGARLQEDNEVLLVRTDQSGRAWPVNVSEPPESKGGRRKRQMVETHEDKERVRYFKDDDNQSLQDLVRKEKMGTAEDQNKLFMRMASKFMEKTDKEYYTLDDMFVSKTARKESADKEDEREREQAISEHRKLAARMEKCPYCFDNPELPKHLIVAIGKKVYVCLPNYLSLTDGHCLIAPLQHYHAATLLDEDIWEEMQVFRKALVRMFESNGLDCVFLETNLDMKKRYHMVYECIPLPKEVGDMAPIYFKKAIMESDEEWSMNKKLIDLSARNVRKSVPKGLPYFSVDFGLQGGYAHVIEDQHKFPHYFGKEIIGGMLDLEPRVWRKAVRENFDDQRKKVLQFAQWWKPHDFTKTKD